MQNCQLGHNDMVLTLREAMKMILMVMAGDHESDQA